MVFLQFVDPHSKCIGNRATIYLGTTRWSDMVSKVKSRRCEFAVCSCFLGLALILGSCEEPNTEAGKELHRTRGIFRRSLRRNVHNDAPRSMPYLNKFQSHHLPPIVSQCPRLARELWPCARIVFLPIRHILIRANTSGGPRYLGSSQFQL